jgi:hypothetical protein
MLQTMTMLLMVTTLLMVTMLPTVTTLLIVTTLLMETMPLIVTTLLMVTTSTVSHTLPIAMSTHQSTGFLKLQPIRKVK